MKKVIILAVISILVGISIFAFSVICEIAPCLLSKLSYYIGDTFTWMLVLSAVLGALALFLRKAEN